MGHGSKALEVFYDQTKMMYGNADLPASFNAFKSVLKTHKDRSYRILEDSLTNAIQAMYDDSMLSWGIENDVEMAMTKLAKISQGKLPNSGAFIQALADKFSEVTLSEYYEKVEEAVEAFQNVGKGVLTTMNLSRYAIPAIAIGGAALFVYFRVRKA
jgi:hypothetical protein